MGLWSRRTVTAGVLLALGIGFTAWSGRLVTNASAVRAWPTTQGRVTHSEMISAVDPADFATTMHTASVAYTYVVGSRTYTATRITLADHSSSRPAGIARVVARYSVGSSVTVHYHPDDPSSSILETRTPLPLYGPLLLGLLATVTALVAVARSAERSHRCSPTREA